MSFFLNNIGLFFNLFEIIDFICLFFWIYILNFEGLFGNFLVSIFILNSEVDKLVIGFVVFFYI